VRRAVQQRRRRNIYFASGGVGLAAVVIGVILIVNALSGPSNSGPAPGSAPGSFPLPASVVSQVTGVPVSALVAAAEANVPPGAAGVSPKHASPPQGIAKNPVLTSGGKPEIVYMGAEYCPYCAGERWALIMALSKFGTFSGLSGTSSSTIDINPSSPTFTFYGSTYKSPYITFVTAELETNTYDSSTGAYPSLQQPTSQEVQLITKWDAPPYAPAGQSEPIPFIYIGGRYVLTGIQYDASKIAGMGITDAATYLTSGKDTTSRDAEAAAGYLVGDICALTHGKPASVCSAVPSSLIGATTSSVAHKGSSK
jgi:thiol-disulfide isomerase/thioredoxin